MSPVLLAQTMELELRYERLRKRQPPQEQPLLASLAEIGQQLPIVVVREPTRYILIDLIDLIDLIERGETIRHKTDAMLDLYDHDRSRHCVREAYAWHEVFKSRENRLRVQQG